MSEQPYILREAGAAYQAKHQWIPLPSGDGILLSQYFALGDPVAKLTVSQGKSAHANLPADMPSEQVHFEFDRKEAEGLYAELGMKPVQGVLVWNQAGRFYTLGGDSKREELIKQARELSV